MINKESYMQMMTLERLKQLDLDGLQDKKQFNERDRHKVHEELVQ